MAKSSVYTGTGDKGETSLVGGQRVLKSEIKIESYGTADELNSQVGLALSLASNLGDHEVEVLHSVQNNLFNLGSLLATVPEDRAKFKLPPLNKNLISTLESEMDKMDGTLPKLTNFILPAGTSGSSAFHVCRTVCRRLERIMVQLGNLEGNEIHQDAIQFVNRLSDYFFVLSRSLNAREGISDILWSKD